ncbi:membrane protein [Amycolatopsis sp. MJM2582]|uniref:YdcF family protein n=1 Tax=Amycolatopsis TaxID=1813 RepID=UPI00050621FC|nr:MULTISPECIES: YdcF family protein [unclassified Amycolatopsis]KFZ79129.1 membrane protein [Amycolatopsis sp. MJM2582]RSN40839.1 YdcF family protein [Amycolatopsis sp. WAC 04197]
MSTAERTKPTRASWVRRTLAGFLLIVVALIGGTAFRVWQVAREDVRDRADVIVVLGAAQYNGRPSEIFRSRLEKAKALYDQGVAEVIVTAGGKKADDNYTEAHAGAQWLRKRGVPVSATLPVGEGSDTLRSLRAVAEQVQQRGWKTAVLVSDPWHSFRARVMADDLGLDAWTSPTHRGPIVQARETQARYIVRETGALLYYRLTRFPAEV